MTELAEVAEVTGDAEIARHVLAECGRYSGRIAVSGTCVNRPFDQALAQAALAAGDADLAEEYASRAVAASRERETPVFLCRELVFLAEADGAPAHPGRTFANSSRRPARSLSASGLRSCSSTSAVRTVPSHGSR